MKSARGSLVHQKFSKLITIINELKNLGIQPNISLDRILVVGSRMSGKSSVLEALFDLNFLPIGEVIYPAH